MTAVDVVASTNEVVIDLSGGFGYCEIPEFGRFSSAQFLDRQSRIFIDFKTYHSILKAFTNSYITPSFKFISLPSEPSYQYTLSASSPLLSSSLSS